MAGKMARCPQCGHKISIAAAPPPTPTTASKPAAPLKQKPRSAPASAAARPRKETTAKPAAKAAANANATDTSPQSAARKSTWFKVPQVSRGMRWFLVIVVAPLAAIFLLGEIVPPIIRMFRGSPTSTSSGTFGGTPEEREALLQQLAEYEAQQQQQAPGKQQASPPKAKDYETPAGIPGLNGDRFGMPSDAFREKYRDKFGSRPKPTQGRNPAGNNVKVETLFLSNDVISESPNDVSRFIKNRRYTFHNEKLAIITAHVLEQHRDELNQELTALFQKPPVEIEVQKSSEAHLVKEEFGLPQLRWENSLVRITLTPVEKMSENIVYLYRVHHKGYAD